MSAQRLLTDDDLRAIWRAAGGSFHGPNIEHGSMAEALLLPFLRRLIEGPIEPLPDNFSGFDELLAELERDSPKEMAAARQWVKDKFYPANQEKEGWMEIECEECDGIDYDINLSATTCPIGHKLSAKALAEANRYDADGNCINERSK